MVRVCVLISMARLRRKREDTNEGPVRKRPKSTSTPGKLEQACHHESSTASTSSPVAIPQDDDSTQNEVQKLKRTLDILTKGRDVDIKKFSELMNTYSVLIGLLTTRVRQLESEDKASQTAGMASTETDLSVMQHGGIAHSDTIRHHQK